MRIQPTVRGELLRTAEVASLRSIALPSLAFLAGVGITFWPIFPALLASWLNDSDNSHGLLIPIFVAYMVWQVRHDLIALPIRPSAFGAVLTAFALLLYLFALRTQLLFPGRIALVIAVGGIAWLNLGTAWMRKLAFPLAFLSFMVPVPDTIQGMLSFPLQLFTTWVSANLLHLLTIPVLREGNMLYFASASLEVADACSGIRSMTSYVILATLFAFLDRHTHTRTQSAVLLASALPLAVLVNIVRVAGTGVLAAFAGASVARGFLHDFSGLLVFVIGFFALRMVSASMTSSTLASRRVSLNSVHPCHAAAPQS